MFFNEIQGNNKSCLYQIKKKTQTKRISSFSFFMALISIYNIFFFTPYALSFIPSPWQW